MLLSDEEEDELSSRSDELSARSEDCSTPFDRERRRLDREEGAFRCHRLKSLLLQ